MTHRIYLDNNASTSVDPRVLRAVVANMQESIGNSSAVHSFGQDARNQIARARRTIADFLGAKPQEIIFTSGGTEGINMMIRGLFSDASRPGHIITSSVEHACVYNTVKHLEKQGCEATYLSPGLWGAVKPEDVQAAIRQNTRLILLMAVNNETGVKTDIEEIARIAHSAKIPFVVDAIALLGKESFVIPEGVSAMCFSGHKIHAPSGIGAVFIRQGIRVTPLLFGGPQEYNRRGGTENVPGIIGFAEAISILKEIMPSSVVEIKRLRDRLEAGLMNRIPNIVINGQAPRVVNTSNISFPNVDGETLLMNLDLAGVAVSHGSACISGALEPSRVLLNMGIPMSQARSTIRFSLSRFTTEEEIDSCIEIISKLLKAGK